MKILRILSATMLSLITLPLGFSIPITVLAATAPTLGAATNYAVFGKA